MRTKLITILAVMVVALTACNSKDKPNGILKNGEFVYINVKNTTMRVIESNDIPTVEGDKFTRMTPKQLVEKCGMFYFYDPIYEKEVTLGIGDVQKDIENARIMMWGEQIINKDGTLNEGFLDWKDVRIMVPIKDGNVGGYIPNAVMKEASDKIRKAYKEGNLDEVYRLFKDAFTAIPITEMEWKALKAQGKQ